MFWVVAGGSALEGVTAELEPLSDALPSSPGGGIVGDPRADLPERRCVRMPDPGADEYRLRLQVEVEAGRVCVLRKLVPELNAHVRLVGRLVFREARVAVDAEERSTRRPRVRDKIRADSLEMRGDIGDEVERRPANVVLVAALVRREPVPVVVRFQISQEPEERRSKRPLRRTASHRGPLYRGIGSCIVIASKVSRAAILHAADSARLQRLVQGHGMRVGAARFVAGETLDKCVAVIRRLNEAGLYANTTLLGEAIPDAAGAEIVTEEYERIVDRLVTEELRANVALKLTHLGLSFDASTAYANVERLVAHAADRGSFIRIDMEQSEHLEETLQIYEQLRAAGHESVGTVLQTYLYRTPDDLARLLPLRPNLRIVKGAYLEPAEIAYPEKKDVDRAYLEIVEQGLRGDAYIAAATHDEAIIRQIQALVEREGIGRDRFEFQMLYGVRPALQRSIAADCYKVLVATPYGPDWYPYLMRRLAERPANLGFFLRSLVRR